MGQTNKLKIVPGQGGRSHAVEVVSSYQEGDPLLPTTLPPVPPLRPGRPVLADRNMHIDHQQQCASKHLNSTGASAGDENAKKKLSDQAAIATHNKSPDVNYS